MPPVYSVGKRLFDMAIPCYRLRGQGVIPLRACSAGFSASIVQGGEERRPGRAGESVKSGKGAIENCGALPAGIPDSSLLWIIYSNVAVEIPVAR